ncbi:MAG: hypothetical protein IH892_17015 [Planctomycetes bacterium]|nr:hypothetical protein [Planctomycetota bacterium]
MTLRCDEQFVVDCLVNSLGDDSTVVWGEVVDDPPDVLIQVDNVCISLEISQLTPISFDSNGKTSNRFTEDTFGIDLCNSLDTKYGSQISDGKSLCLVLYVPVSNARKYKKELDKVVASLVSSCPPIGTQQTLSIANEKVEIAVHRARAHSNRKIVGIIDNKNSNTNILLNATNILHDRITEKHAKCKDLPGSKVAWFAR